MKPLCKYDTAVTLDLIFQRLWLTFKGISIEKIYTGKLSYTISKTFPQQRFIAKSAKSEKRFYIESPPL
jgi:hypothetical protein